MTTIPRPRRSQPSGLRGWRRATSTPSKPQAKANAGANPSLEARRSRVRKVRSTQAAISARPTAPRIRAVTGAVTRNRRPATADTATPVPRSGPVPAMEHTLHPDRSGNVTALSYRHECISPGWAQNREWPAGYTCPPLQPQARRCARDNQDRRKGAGHRTREVTLDPGAFTDTPDRNQGPGRNLPDRTRAIPCKVQAVTGANSRASRAWRRARPQANATCDPRAIASGRPQSRMASHGHSAADSRDARPHPTCTRPRLGRRPRSRGTGY